MVSKMSFEFDLMRLTQQTILELLYESSYHTFFIACRERIEEERDIDSVQSRVGLFSFRIGY